MLKYSQITNLKPRFHPNGFIQLDLVEDGKVRLHVWPEHDCGLTKQVTDNTVHDHVFDMHSRILLGRLTNVTYRLDKSYMSTNALYEEYEAHYTKKSNSILKPNGEVGFLEQIDRATMVAGSEYELSAYVYHDSIADGLTATIMTKTRVRTERSCRMLCELGKPPDNDFKRDAAPADLMFNQIAKVFEALGGSIELPFPASVIV